MLGTDQGRTGGLRGAGAFTLIELLIVVIIVGILAAAAVPLYMSQADRARRSEAQAGLSAVRTMMAAYMTEHGHYPEDIGALAMDFSDNSFFDGDAFSIIVDGADFIIQAEGQENSSAPRGEEVEGFVVQMNRQGAVRYHRGDGQWNTSDGDWSLAESND